MCYITVTILTQLCVLLTHFYVFLDIHLNYTPSCLYAQIMSKQQICAKLANKMMCQLGT